ncbi:uncharacterized protein N7477_006391 [Penicillium maclennaniae]|uniref:uncharacterized protein n=1 Tax=Penicillium maclennaniae TaxID=1343394 RepID=UPI00253F82FD|nr:uncharacterized protein N7477_006391 [Penicillium maclennaniae]KAJ5667821.1 hypothetical protein N7477_006391 [Penicillium maclennaniae]
MTRLLRIAVLECDTPIPPVQAKFGGYGDIFESLLKKGLEESGSTAEIEVSKWHVVENPVYPDPNECDAFLLTGSKHDAFSDDRWILTLTEYIHDVVKAHKKPVVGICFGHQILARALGKRVSRGDSWEISSSKITLTDAGKELFGKDELHLHQMHRDIVHEVPEGCINLGYSDPCAIQGFYMPNRLLTVQAHPEFNEYIMSHLVEARHNGGVFNDELAQDGAARAGNHHDGALVAKKIIEFINSSVA